MKLVRNLKLSLGVLAVGSLMACGGGGGGGGSAATGTLKLAMTDAPACGYESVNVTIEKVRVHQSSTASDTDSGWSEIVLSPALEVDLLALQNGALAELGQVTLPTGSYNQMRLVLADNNGASSPANWVKLTSNISVVELKTPSGQQSGVKAKQFNIDIGANQLANFVIDFDACKSVVIAGSGKYLLKPQLTVVPRLISGVAGFVAPALTTTGFTNLSLQQGGVVVKATAPASNGTFMLQPVAPGSYTLVMTMLDRTTTVVTNVVVAADTVTSVNTALTAFAPAVSASGSVTGTATPAVETLEPLVRVLQPLTAGPAIEVAGRFVDITTGSYSYPLVVNAPMVAPYVALPGALVFAADTAAAGRYTIEASLTGFTTKTTVLTPLAVGAMTMTNFIFP
ncbi:MAG: DUF4382 domain-containing protein [Rhodoferax sp.]|nr:DUF4382 domain-containing protein [Rhodoferax sp.]